MNLKDFKPHIQFLKIHHLPSSKLTDKSTNMNNILIHEEKNQLTEANNNSSGLLISKNENGRKELMELFNYKRISDCKSNQTNILGKNMNKNDLFINKQIIPNYSRKKLDNISPSNNSSRYLSKGYIEVINNRVIRKNLKTKKLKKNKENSKKAHIKFYYLAISFLVIVNLIITLIDNELAVIYLAQYYEQYNGSQQTINIEFIEKSSQKLEYGSLVNILRIVNIAIILVVDFILIMIYKDELKIQKYYCYCTNEDNLFSSGLWKNLFIEIFILSLSTPPFTFVHIIFNQYGMGFIYTLNSFIAALFFLKLYVIFKTFALFSKWRNSDNLPICNKYFGKPIISFTFKATFNQNPITVLMIIFIISIIYLSLLLNFFNIGVFFGNQIDGYLKYNEDLETSTWVILETCITLGYGEIVTPKTTISRVIAISSALIGWTCISLLILFSKDLLELDVEENNAYIRYKKLEIENKTKQKAFQVIKSFLQFNLVLIKKEHKTHEFLLSNNKYQIGSFLKKFKTNSKLNLNDSYNLSKEILRQEVMNYIPNYFIRFYNKFISFNELNQCCIAFNKSMNNFKSYFPSSTEEMSRVSKNLDCNYDKLKRYITSRFRVFRRDFEILENETNLFNSKMKGILEVQKKIYQHYIKFNNEISEENSQEINLNIIRKIKRPYRPTTLNNVALTIK